jgi:hypothetical protein
MARRRAPRRSASAKAGRGKKKAITVRQKSARRKNIAVARAAKPKAKKKKVLRGKARKSGMSARMEHELHRFTTMTDKQLTTRLKKITKPKKLAAFVEMAKWTGKRKLGREAQIKLNYLS